MPTYEYLCGKCDHEFEREQRITDDPVKTCPKCRSRKVQRLISSANFVLKGGGWYSDLYSTPKKTEDKGKDEGKKADSGDGASSGGDSGTSSGTSDDKSGKSSDGKGSDGKKSAKPKSKKSAA